MCSVSMLYLEAKVLRLPVDTGLAREACAGLAGEVCCLWADPTVHTLRSWALAPALHANAWPGLPNVSQQGGRWGQ